jgi:uncharacterized protein YjbI with pentapeptide repeats
VRSAILADADLEGANLQGARITMGIAKLPADLQAMLRDHAIWVESNGLKGARADLSGQPLAEANLSECYLFGGNLRGANLANGTFILADMRERNLTAADLTRADVSGADISEGVLKSARLDGLIASAIALRGADGKETGQKRLTMFANADFFEAHVGAADLSEADFTGAKNV